MGLAITRPFFLPRAYLYIERGERQMVKKVFVTYTPFHLLTACGYASGVSDASSKILLVFKDFPNSELYIDALHAWSQNPFEVMVVLDAGMQLDQKTMGQRFRFSKKKLQLVKKFWRDQLDGCPDGYEVYSFNDDTVESQFLFRKNTRDRNFYMEDGLSSYYFDPNVRNLRFIAKKIIRKIMFGSWVERPYPLGSTSHVNAIYSYYPALVVAQLKKKMVQAMPPDVFDVLVEKGYVDILMERVGLEIKETNGPAAVLLFPVSWYLERVGIAPVSYAKQVISVFHTRFPGLRELYLKCHPREPDTTTTLLVREIEGLKIVKNNVAAEILFLALKKKVPGPIMLAGPATTAFVTARFILGNRVEITHVQDDLTTSTEMDILHDTLNVGVYRLQK